MVARCYRSRLHHYLCGSLALGKALARAGTVNGSESFERGRRGMSILDDLSMLKGELQAERRKRLVLERRVGLLEKDHPEPNVPEGYVKLRAIEVWTNGERLVILGQPPDEDEVDPESEYAHNCDAMGCGSFGPHVIAIGEYLYGDPLEFRTVKQIMEHYIPREKELSGKELAQNLSNRFRKVLQSKRV